MASFIISSLTSTPRVLGEFDQYLLLPGVSHYNLSTVVQSNANRVDITVLGSLVSLNSSVILANGENSHVIVGPTGSITATSSYIAMQMYGNDSSLTNAGFITGAQIEAAGDNFWLSNSGTMTSAYDASDDIAWLEFQNPNATLVNTGTISTSRGVAVAVQAAAATGFRLVNDGLISSGTDGVTVQTLSLSVGLTIQNAGSISAADLAILGGNGVDLITNSGVISGDVDLRDGDDVLVNSGQLVGEVTLGDGADMYKAVNAGFATSLLDGGVGNDTLMGAMASDELLGGVDDDLLFGGGGNDTLFGDNGLDTVVGGEGQDLIRGGNDVDVVRGGQGDDTVYGDGGADQVYGGSGADELFGGSEGDRMFGGDGNDVLSGDAGADRMLGDGGDDTMDGGAGRDDLNGGLGADTFLFDAVADSAIGGGQEDRIYDFSQAQGDLIDLSGIVGPELAFFGVGGFGAGAGVRLLEVGGNTLVDVDTNNDNVADMRIFVLGVTAMTADDFVL